MVISNAIKLPFYLKYLVDKKLLNILVSDEKVSKEKARKPTDVTLHFITNDLCLKNIIIKYINSLPSTGLMPKDRFRIDDKDYTSHSFELKIYNFQALRAATREPPMHHPKRHIILQQYKITLERLKLEYLTVGKAALLRKLEDNKDVLLKTREFNLEDFMHKCREAKTFEEVSEYHIEIDSLQRKGVDILQAQSPIPLSPTPQTPIPQPPHSARRASLPGIEVVIPSTPKDNAPATPIKRVAAEFQRAVSVPPMNIERYEIPTPQEEKSITSDNDSDNEETPSPTLMNDVLGPDSATSWSHQQEGSPRSPRYPRYNSVQVMGAKIFSSVPEPRKVSRDEKQYIDPAKFSQELVDFVKECETEPLPKNLSLPKTAGLLCTSTHEICQIPVRINLKLYDFAKLRKLANFDVSAGILDPSGSGKIVSKCYILPDFEVRKQTLSRIAQQDFFIAFNHQHNKVFADAGFFNRSHYRPLVKSGRIKNFDDLVDFIIKHPKSRSAKIFVAMESTVEDPLKAFLKSTYLPDYQKSWFARSNFLQKIQQGLIIDYEDAYSYANFTENAHTRTARLMLKT